MTTIGPEASCIYCHATRDTAPLEDFGLIIACADDDEPACIARAQVYTAGMLAVARILADISAGSAAGSSPAAGPAGPTAREHPG